MQAQYLKTKFPLAVFFQDCEM